MKFINKNFEDNLKKGSTQISRTMSRARFLGIILKKHGQPYNLFLPISHTITYKGKRRGMIRR
jgi:hypothetical protein